MLELFKEKDILHQLRWLNDIHPEKSIFKGRHYMMARRILDIVIIVLTLPLWLPLFIITTGCIKLSSPHAPVFFIQWRTGKGGHRFRMYKFRTMVQNAEKQKRKYAFLNILQWPDFKIKDDPRVTRIGRLLRKLSLDELPQILNVLAGDMALVGPRPTSIHPKKYSRWQMKRFEVLPGITGLWQIAGRGSTNFDTRIRLDIAYIEHQCLWLDVQILLLTLSSIIKQRGTF